MLIASASSAAMTADHSGDLGGCCGFPAITQRKTADARAMRGLVQDVEEGYAHRIAFVAPSAAASWPLPLYELALQTANRAYDMNATVDICVVSPETAPLAALGSGISDGLSTLLDEAGIAFYGSSFPQLSNDTLTLRPGGAQLRDARVVAMPVLEGPQIAGLPADEHGFIAVTAYGEVRGLPGVYAAGDVTSSAVKHGGLAAQQADLRGTRPRRSPRSTSARISSAAIATRMPDLPRS